MRDGSSFVLDNVKYISELRRNLISMGTLEKEGFTVKMQLGKMKAIKGSLVGRKQLGEYQIGWKIKMDNVLDKEDTTMSTYLVNRSPSPVIRFKTPIDMLGFFGWLASIKQGMLEPVKVKCIFLGYRKGMVDNKLWRFDDVTSNVVLYRNMSFNESGEYKKTFIGSGVGTSSMRSMQVLHGFEFKEVQTQDLIYYHPARDREQHSVWKLFGYREDIACEVISKRKARLKDDMDARSDVYVLNNGCKKCSDDSDGFVRGTLHTVVEGKGKCTKGLLEGHSILSLKGSLSGDCDVEKNGKWSCIYEVGSHEYQVVCTRLTIAYADVGMLDKFDRGLQRDVQVFVDFDYAMGRSITVMGRSITRYGLMIQGCAGS
ncbi:hypothetical protein Tco_1487652 [Tanacetum coccineum]